MKKLILNIAHVAHVTAPIAGVVACKTPEPISETLKFDLHCDIYRANRSITKSRKCYRKMVKK